MNYQQTIMHISFGALTIAAEPDHAHAENTPHGTAEAPTQGNEQTRPGTSESESQTAFNDEVVDDVPAAAPPASAPAQSQSSPAVNAGPSTQAPPAAPAPLSLADQMRELHDYADSEREKEQLRLKEEAPTWVVHINPLNLVFDEIMLGVDYGVGDRTQVTGQVSYYETRVVATDNVGISVGGGIRYFPASNGYRGWYISPTVSFRLLSMENEVTGESGTGRLLVPMAMAGRQWLWGPVMFRVGAGLGYLFDVGTEVDGTLNTEVNTAVFGLDGALGIAL